MFSLSVCYLLHWIMLSGRHEHGFRLPASCRSLFLGSGDSMGPFCLRACLSFSSCPNNLSRWPQDQPPSLWKWKANLSLNFPCTVILQTCSFSTLHFLCLGNHPPQFPRKQWANVSLWHICRWSQPHRLCASLHWPKMCSLPGRAAFAPGRGCVWHHLSRQSLGATPHKAGEVLAPVSPRGRKSST